MATVVLVICLSQVYLYFGAKAEYEAGGQVEQGKGPTWGFVDYSQFVAKQDKEATKSRINDAFLLGTFVSGGALISGAVIVHGLMPYFRKKSESH